MHTNPLQRFFYDRQTIQKTCTVRDIKEEPNEVIVMSVVISGETTNGTNFVKSVVNKT